MSFYEEKLVELKADGIDFLSFRSDKHFPEIICSYTKEELKNVSMFPRTNYKYWKLINGKKVYIIC